MEKFLTCAVVVVVLLALIVLGVFLQALLIEWVWNNLIAPEMNWQPITRNAAYGVSILAWLLFGGKSASASSKKS